VPDLSFIESAAAVLAPHLRPGAGVVLESTTYPRTTEELVRPILESASGLVAGRDFHLGYSPERIDPGNTEWTLATTPKVVSAVSPESLAAVADFYASLVEVVVPVSDTRVAELAKLMENTFRHVNVALVNEMAMFAEELGIDIWEAVQAAGTKPFGFMSFSPGPGVGGHCLPVDPSYLSWRVKKSLGKSFRFVELANDINDHMPHYVVDRVIEGLNRRRQAVAGSRIVLLGLAYKKNSSDVRESPAIAIAERLAGLGAVVQAVDPHVGVERPAGLEMAPLTPELLGSADAVVLVTDHDAFDYDLIACSGRYVLDTRHRLRGAPGVEYL
jgi:UDP-N-acetyl-D-glucosamine dehydrogenase